MADPTIKDLAYRGLASVLGGPVDLATMVMRPFGYNVPEQQVVGGSEWIGKQLEDVGLVSSARAPVQEFITSMAIPTPSGLAKGAALGGAALVGAVKAGGKTSEALQGVAKTIQYENLPYQITHKPMTVEGGAATIDNLIPSFGPDIYGKNALQYFGSGDPREAKILNTLRKIRGNPNATVTIYRGVPENVKTINPGDWVTLSEDVAKDYGNVIKMDVPAKDITGWSDSLMEFGYYPK